MRHDLVVCAYGDSPYLPDCLRSLAALHGGYTTLTVVSSTPSPYQRMAAESVRALFVVNERPPSIGSDWNFALSVAHGPLVTLCHQDDTYMPDFAHRTQALFANHADVVLASTGHVELLDGRRRKLSPVLLVKRLLMRNAFRGRQVSPAHDIRRRLLAFGNPVCCSSATFNKPLLGDFAFSERLHSNLDWDAWSRLAETPHLFGYIPDVLVARRVHGASATTRCMADNSRAREDLEMFLRYWPRPAARGLMRLYQRSYGSNATTT